ncbi:MAG: T9SS type A sorting domain-containing protein [Bacteroidetes bacterium]|nr:T9SS type A sorting domain-containing protein [Bacteroidota bacterium]
MVTLKVYDLLGREIATLVNEEKSPGKYEVKFSAEGGGVTNLPSGVYFYTLRAGDFLETKKMLLMK